MNCDGHQRKQGDNGFKDKPGGILDAGCPEEISGQIRNGWKRVLDLSGCGGPDEGSG
ncbi:MAG: hypothetical protein KAI15_00775 [Gammaproteobacteria bacterium]|nr:hypothetical protein [Gammaproteobacteria bacterium]